HRRGPDALQGQDRAVHLRARRPHTPLVRCQPRQPAPACRLPAPRRAATPVPDLSPRRYGITSTTVQVPRTLTAYELRTNGARIASPTSFNSHARVVSSGAAVLRHEQRGTTSGAVMERAATDFPSLKVAVVEDDPVARL